MLGKFYKRHENDKIWWVNDIGFRGHILFSFDKKKVFNFFRDYPHNLTSEQKAIFDSENPFWANFYLDKGEPGEKE